MKHMLPAITMATALLAASCSSDDVASVTGTGKVSPDFAVDYSVTDSRSLTRSTSEEATVKPDLSEFTFRLTSEDGTTDEVFASLDSLTQGEYTAGTYTLTATYGDIAEEGIDKAYYCGETTFAVTGGETATPALTATLANTAVSLTYTDLFTQYFTQYSATVASASGTATVDMDGDDSTWAYLTPGDITLTVSYTKQNGVSGSVEAATIEAAEAGAHYSITVDVNGGEAGSETITITFDASTDIEPVTVDISDDVVNAPYPVITPTGFTSGVAISVTEGSDVGYTVKAAIVAQAGLAEVNLTIDSPTPALASVLGTIELLSATTEQQSVLTAAGLSCKGVWSSPGQLAEIDFTGLIPNLAAADGSYTHTFTILAKDNYSHQSDTVTLIVETK